MSILPERLLAAINVGCPESRLVYDGGSLDGSLEESFEGPADTALGDVALEPKLDLALPDLPSAVLPRG